MRPTQMPATCELCGSWLPQHQSSCPRNGVHPSQWSMADDTLYRQPFFCLLDISVPKERLDDDDDSDNELYL
ncbi:hypothetical protein VTP01DRAFT_7807 [Rhizomucor pusillus]|uniref:uncharacterized protein n=1 Tax=Rhizomucor pusillus TaxID=4840 RepID=UPI0037448CC7